MKKHRVSNVQAYHGLILEEVSRKREELARKFAPKNEPRSAVKIKQKTDKQKVKTNNTEYIPLNVHKAKDHQYLIDRADENVRHWGTRMKIPVDEVKILAARLKASVKSPTKNPMIRYQNPSERRPQSSKAP